MARLGRGAEPELLQAHKDEDFVRRKVASGRYSSETEVISAGFRLLSNWTTRAPGDARPRAVVPARGSGQLMRFRKRAKKTD